jgi:hypothetical protein
MAQGAANPGDYQLEKVVARKSGKTKLETLRPVDIAVSYNPNNDTVEIDLPRGQPLKKGGLLTVNTAVASAMGNPLAGSNRFAIGKGGRHIGPA